MTYERGIRIYGELRRGSFGQVTQGLRQAAERTDLFLGMKRYDVEENLQFNGGSEALVAVSAGQPKHVALAHATGRHRHRWILIAPNSEGFTKGLIDSLVSPAPLGEGTMVDGILVPSMWALRVLAQSDEIPAGFPAYCAPHGVGDEYRVIDLAVDALRTGYGHGWFMVAHLTSTHTARKGTRELVEAWKMLREGPWKGDKGTRLSIVTHPAFLAQHNALAAEVGGYAEGITVMPGLSFTRNEMVGAISHAHVVCQPSRAEGFGMVPLEAAHEQGGGASP